MVPLLHVSCIDITRNAKFKIQKKLNCLTQDTVPGFSYGQFHRAVIEWREMNTVILPVRSFPLQTQYTILYSDTAMV